jgi:GT2 family glycosyltransferase
MVTMAPFLMAMTPFRADKNLGAAYNEAMSLLPEGGWALLMDHDMHFTTTQWWHQCQAAIAAEPDGTFTAVTNNIASKWQRATEGDERRRTATGDRPLTIGEHREIGQARLANRNLLDVTATAGIGGVVILISKANWKLIGGFADGMFCVDHQMHFALRDAGRRVYLIEGLYVYHHRSSSSDRSFVGPVAVNPRTGRECHCRRHPETDPNVRRGM